PGTPEVDFDWTAVVHPEEREGVRAAWQRALESGTALDLECRILDARTGTYRPHACGALPLRDRAGGIERWLGTFASLDDSKLTGETARQLAEVSRRRDEFLAVLAHELRNPLAPIRNWATALREQPAERHQEALEVIDRQLSRLARLVDDLFDASRISEGKLRIRKEVFDVRLAVTEAVEAVTHEIGARGHALEVRMPSPSFAIEADPVRLDQILVNLLGNAARYTENGGHLELAVEREGTDLVVRVKDDGIGIPREMLATIFEPYTQLDASWRRQHGGLGIGLAVVKSLVTMHGGTVEAQSEGERRGSEFVVRLPIVRAEAAAEPAPPPPRPAPAVQSARKRVLVVDDNEDSADSLGMLLTSRGHDVRVEHDGPAALNAALEHRPEVVLLDLGLPGMDGCEVAVRLREQPETRTALLIALTGFAHEEARERAKRAGFDHHLVKPVFIRDLLDVIAVARPNDRA
ncbi:MAG: hybrid sensor histidine kinase/response regulator, partial [bacterium]